MAEIRGSLQTQYKYHAFFSRANYNWKDKIIINLSARRDGSSRFGSANKFHNFGAIGAAWIFSEEELVKKHVRFLSFGKVRLSYGTTGNDQIPDYSFLSLYGQVSNVDVPYQGTTTLQPEGLPNFHLQWEETKKLQFGLDLGLIRDRILINSTYSSNRSSNQLLGYALPTTTGFTNITTNFPATIQNKSLEISLRTVNVKTHSVSWITNTNFTIAKNELQEFPGIENSNYARTLIIGQPLNIQRVYHFLGVDPVTGVYQVDDGKGVPTTSFPDERTVVVNTLPKYYGGLENSFTYKGFQVDFLFQFVKQLGVNARFDNNSTAPGEFNRGYSNQPISVLSRWQKSGDISNIQRFSTSLSTGLAKFSDGFYSDASFIRLKNASISWQIPRKWKETINMKNARLYLSGQNLVTISKYQGLDPETRSLDVLPPLKVISIGAQISM